MSYKNRGGRSREDCMKAVYVLYNEFEASQQSLADAFRCSTSTISAWNKEYAYKERIFRLERELEETRNSQHIDSMDAINNAQYEQHIEYLNSQDHMSGVDSMDAINNAQYEQHIEYLNSQNR